MHFFLFITRNTAVFLKFLTLFITIIFILAPDSVNSMKTDNDKGSEIIYKAKNRDYHDYTSYASKRYRRQINRKGQECKIPKFALNTIYSILDDSNTNYRPGDYVKKLSILEISCTQGYKLGPFASSISICRNSQWREPPTACLRACPSLQSTETATVKCKYNEIPLENCTTPVQETTALLTCNPYYEKSNPHGNQLHVCKNGKWDPPVSECNPICGIKSPKGRPNIINGEITTPGDYPWQVGIYNEQKEFFCGGSIIDQHIILSAAHCFTDYNGNTFPSSNYFVAAGKFYRTYNHSKDEIAQYSTISEIHVPERYASIKGLFAFDIAILILKDAFTLSIGVQPVCIELNEESQYLHVALNNMGIITGWGYTEEGINLSEKLKELVIPYVPYKKCYQELTERFRKFFTFDKLCGGYLNSTTSVCGGDSGGGWVFKNTFNDRYFVKGIVSTSPSTQKEVSHCDSNQYSLYTAVDHHIGFIRNIIAFNRRQQSIEIAQHDNTEEDTENSDGCWLPNFPQHGKYFISNRTYEPGKLVRQWTMLSLTCDNGYKTIPAGVTKSYCFDKGQWAPPPATCIPLKNIRVVCYYVARTAFHAGFSIFSPRNINPHLCTHIIYAYGDFTKEYTIKPLDDNIDIQSGGYANVTGLKNYNPDLKVMLSLKGWNESSDIFSSIVASSEGRKQFIQNSIAYLRQYNFDGLDITWGVQFEKDRYGYSSLIQELREEYEKESEETDRSRLLLSIVVPVEKYFIDNVYDVPKLTKYVDWMNILSFNYHSEFEPVVNHHSQLYGLPNEADSDLNINHTMSYYLRSGAESEKLVLGIPTFGGTYKLTDPNMTNIGSAASGPGVKGKKTEIEGLLAYHEICKKIKDEGWIVEQPNPNVMGPYAYKDNQWVAYDDENIVRKKAKFVAENKLGGIMIWLLEYDDFKGYCTGKLFPLIEAAKESLIAASQ